MRGCAILKMQRTDNRDVLKMTTVEPTSFVTIYCTYEDVDAPRQMLPGIVAESIRTNSAIVMHDSSVENEKEIAAVANENRGNSKFFFMHTDVVSMAVARNLALYVALEKYVPEYICMIEDDHGFREGLIDAMVEAMKRYYGAETSGGLRFGLFTACPFCWGEWYVNELMMTEDGHGYVDTSKVPEMQAGGANSCFRCAPTRHWLSVLKGYDTDEYPISPFQTSGLNFRNYHKGFTALVVKCGQLVERVERSGRGFTAGKQERPFDVKYTRRDPRSRGGPPEGSS